MSAHRLAEIARARRGKRSPRKGKRYPAEILTADECRALLAGCSGRAPTGLRNRCLLALLWRAGLRISEALALRVSDLNLEAGTLRVLHGKGDKARTVGVDPEACAVVARWLDRRAALGFNGRQPMLCTLGGKRVSRSYTATLLHRLADKAGIEKRVTPHTLRHCFAVELDQERVPVRVIQQALGHSSAATTAMYLSHLSADEVVETIRARSWRKPKGKE